MHGIVFIGRGIEGVKYAELAVSNYKTLAATVESVEPVVVHSVNPGPQLYTFYRHLHYQ